jgi:chitin disaccharide deacetylase
MRIITNADDFGMDEDTVRATIECLDTGALTSATLMPNMPATGLAAEYARAHPEKSFGVHLTYVADTVEAPLTPPAEIPTLAAPDGKFRPSQALRMAALLGRLSVEEIEKETAAQIQRLIDLGVRVSHVDSHGHLHKFKPFRQALARVLPRFGIRKVRAVQNVYLKRPLKSPTYWLGPLWRRGVAKAFTTTPDFFMPASGTGYVAWPAELLSRGIKGPLEVGVHPGYAEPWRDAERRAIQAFATMARERGNELVTWQEL